MSSANWPLRTMSPMESSWSKATLPRSATAQFNPSIHRMSVSSSIGDAMTTTQEPNEAEIRLRCRQVALDFAIRWSETNPREPKQPDSRIDIQHQVMHCASSTTLYNSPRHDAWTRTPAINPQKKTTRTKSRICKHDGCTKYVVDRGLCIQHGGGKRCSVEGCNCRAQHRGLCWKHGGYTICTVDGCTKRAKSRGICWSHGGGTKCQLDDCTKIAVSRGLCWAHGGGKRCQLEGCKKPASGRTQDWCEDHFVQHFVVSGSRPTVN